MGSIKPTYYTDDYRLCRKYTRVGKAPRIDIFSDRRAAMTFPGAGHDGYFCVFGLQDAVAHRDRVPLELLAEGSFKDQDKMFEAVAANMRMMGCQAVYADCSLEFRGSEIAFGKFIVRNSVKNVGLYDASEFDGFKTSHASFEAARAPLDEHGRNGMLKINQKSQLMSDLQIIQEDDYGTGRAWEKFPALNAFNHIMMSYITSPWEKPTKNNGMNGSFEGYGG